MLCSCFLWKLVYLKLVVNYYSSHAYQITLYCVLYNTFKNIVFAVGVSFQKLGYKSTLSVSAQADRLSS